MKSYLDDHALQAAFLANQMDRLADLIVAQGETLLEDVGVDFPARAVSAVLIIGERGTVSAAEIAEKLGQPHQVTTQRVEHLINDGIVTRTPDPSDGRRKLLTLTKRGKQQFKALYARLETTCQVFQQLSDEIGCDLAPIFEKMTVALHSQPLVERARAIEAHQPSTRKGKSTS